MVDDDRRGLPKDGDELAEHLFSRLAAWLEDSRVTPGMKIKMMEMIADDLEEKKYEMELRKAPRENDLETL